MGEGDWSLDPRLPLAAGETGASGRATRPWDQPARGLVPALLLTSW